MEAIDFAVLREQTGGGQPPDTVETVLGIPPKVGGRLRLQQPLPSEFNEFDTIENSH